jgi:futalosine hydrolase
MILTIVAATTFEINPLLVYLKKHFKEKEGLLFEKNGVSVQVLITGVGIPQTALNLGSYFSKNKSVLAINAGIAGALNLNLKVGDVLNVVSERFGDLGVEQADGTFTDVHELALINPNEAPFQNGILNNPKAIEHQFLPPANGLTVNKIHGSVSSIKAIKTKYNCDLESMEGAAFFLACLMAKVDFLEIRAISNFVEPRNKENWNIPLAIENLNKVLAGMVEAYL